MNSTDPTADPPVLNQAPRTSRLQFSVRDLLLLTALVSVCLAIGVHFAGFMFVVVVLGLIQVATLLSADWLIRPRNRQALAFVTAASWTTLGSGLLILCIRAVYTAIKTSDASGSWILAECLAIPAAFCYFMAIFRWRRLTVHRRVNAYKVDTDDI